MLFISFLCSLLSCITLSVNALPEPAAAVFQQQHPHQVGFLLPPNVSPPYGKSLPPTVSPPTCRTWDWKHWLVDAKSTFKSMFGRPLTSRIRLGGSGFHSEDEARNVVRFDNDIVLRLNISSLSDRIAITELAESMILDIWSMTRSHVDIRLPKTSTKGFLSLLPAHITHEPLITNLHAAVDYTYPNSKTHLPSLTTLQSLAKSSSSRTAAEDIHYLSDIFFANYQDYDTINQWLRLLESLRPELVKLINLGKTHEGREILGITLKGPNTHAEGKEHEKAAVRGMVIHGAQHAREWIAVSTVCYIAYQMVAGYYVDDKVRNLVDQFEWSFVPVLNADGYEYSWTTDRLWRKNRQPTQVAFCTGIDPDRSWGFKWDPPGAQPYPNNPCSESYRGTKPFAAKESRLMAKYIAETLPSRNVIPIGYIDFHSYSQEILYPFAYDCSVLPKDAEDLAEAAWGAAKAARGVHGRYFDVDSACEGDNFEIDKMLVINGGAAVDWAYAMGKIRYSYSVKLRDTGNHGFLLPRGEIIPSGEEMFAMAKHLGDFILERP